MSAYFPTTFIDMLAASWTPTTQVRLYMFEYAPELASGETDTVTGAYVGINSPSALSQQIGWGPYIVGPSIAMTPGSGNGINWVATELFDLAADFPTTKIRALAFAINNGSPTTDQIMFVTTTPLGIGTIIHNYDGFIPGVDTVTQAKVLFSWKPSPEPTVKPTAREGVVFIDKGPPPYETAGTQHVFIYPQRVNFIANPSFELGTGYWRSNGTLAQTTSAPPGGGYFCGRVTGTPNLVLESNYFPLTYGRRREPGWTIQLKVRGEGKLHIGMLSWDASYRTTASDWGRETAAWELGEGWSYIRTLRSAAGDVLHGLLRLECSGTWMDIDQVCVEPGLLPINGVDWPYFDGDSQYGEVGDFAWYGGTARHHATYSTWYNFRHSTFGRLFSTHVATEDQLPGGIFSDLDALKQGLAHQWVPAGTPMMYHLDVLYPHDPVSPLPGLTGPPLPYKTDIADGVTSPW